MDRELKEKKRAEKRQKCYEKYLEKARNTIKPEDIPEDIDGTLYRELMYTHTVYINDIGGVIAKELDIEKTPSVTRYWVLALGLVPLAVVSILIGSYSKSVGGILLIIGTVMMTYAMIWASGIADDKMRLKIAAECKVACEILESRNKINFHRI